MNTSLKNKTVLVTGGASGIGKGIATRFAQKGCNLLLVDINETDLEKTVNDLNEFSSEQKIRFLCGDLTDKNFRNTIVTYLKEEFESVNILINCAGIYPTRPALEVDEEMWDAVFNLNVKASFFLTQAVASIMIETGIKDGAVINITSTASEVARPGAAPYCSSKAAMKMMTQVLALELAPYGIRVNGVGPGLVETETLLKTLVTEHAKKEHKEKLTYCPMARTAEISEIADATIFIASPHASYITGQNLLVDGGYSAGRVFKTFQHN
jgi:NAD(P)-dependent dehydrogenase (short-subunit alcohol dehydrogenase family)